MEVHCSLLPHPSSLLTRACLPQTDEDFVENEKRYAAMSREILGEEEEADANGEWGL